MVIPKNWINILGIRNEIASNIITLTILNLDFATSQSVKMPTHLHKSIPSECLYTKINEAARDQKTHWQMKVQFLKDSQYACTSCSLVNCK